MEKFENHHVIPISIHWEDIKENIYRLLQDKHRDRHHILWYSKRRYSELTRMYKKYSNWHLLLRPSDIDFQSLMQKEFFENLDKLSEEDQSIHVMKMNELYNYWSVKYKAITDDDFSIDIWWNNIEKFNVLHNWYIDIKKEICQHLINLLK